MPRHFYFPRAVNTLYFSEKRFLFFETQEYLDPMNQGNKNLERKNIDLEIKDISLETREKMKKLPLLSKKTLNKEGILKNSQLDEESSTQLKAFLTEKSINIKSHEDLKQLSPENLETLLNLNKGRLLESEKLLHTPLTTEQKLAIICAHSRGENRVLEMRFGDLRAKYEALSPAFNRKQIDLLMDSGLTGKIPETLARDRQYEKSYDDLFRAETRIDGVNILEGVYSKNFVKTKEFFDLVKESHNSNTFTMVKHGGDEFVLVHKGRIYFGDVGNMGPTNKFAPRLEGNNGNLVDLFLKDFVKITKDHFDGKEKGLEEDAHSAYLLAIKNAGDKRTHLDETAFKNLKPKMNCTFTEYQQAIESAQRYANIRTDKRELAKDFDDGLGKNHNLSSAEYQQKYIEFLEQKVPSSHIHTFLETTKSGEFDKVLTGFISSEENLESIKNNLKNINSFGLDQIEKKQEALEDLYSLLRRVKSDDFSGTPLERIISKQSHNIEPATLLDFQLGYAEIPKETNMTHSQFSALLSGPLEDSLHAAKESKLEGAVGEVPNEETLEVLKMHTGESMEKERELKYINRRIEGLMEKNNMSNEEAHQLIQLEKEQRILQGDIERADNILRKMRRMKKNGLRTSDQKDQYEDLQDELETLQFIESSSGAYTKKFLDRSLENILESINISFSEERNIIHIKKTIIDANNTGSVNGKMKNGYETTDACHTQLIQALQEKFPKEEGYTIVRDGGGKFLLYQFSNEKSSSQSLSSFNENIKEVLKDVNKKTQEILKENTGYGKAAIDSIQRNGLKKYDPSESHAVSGILEYGTSPTKSFNISINDMQKNFFDIEDNN
ncbi:hypothetical protein HON22_01390 [Candidatus Peregrinibacteria bacterium]|jgi:hypothetical protein|nr:hypothetical protein [Candidatus Peregrinibacteria bacterium]